jgi:hypothetical protein
MLPAAPSSTDGTSITGSIEAQKSSMVSAEIDCLLGRDSLRRRAMMEWRQAFRCRPSRTSFKPSASDV